MFLEMQAEVSTEDIMRKMLEAHSLNYVLWLMLKTYGYHSPEHLADKITKIVEEADE